MCQEFCSYTVVAFVHTDVFLHFSFFDFSFRQIRLQTEMTDGLGGQVCLWITRRGWPAQKSRQFDLYRSISASIYVFLYSSSGRKCANLS